MIETRGWNLPCEHKVARYAALVREFYSNMVGRKEKICYVKGKWISFDREEIKKVLKLNELKDGSKFKKLKKDPGH